MTQQHTGTDAILSRRHLITTAASAGAVALAGCTRGTDDGADGDDDDGTTTADQLSGSVTITGSSTVFPVSLAMAEEFQKLHDDVNISVDSTGTGGGFKNHFCTGNSDLNGASRPIQSSEEEQCLSNDVTPIEFQVAGDALTVAVNNDADWVDCMTFDELAQIWQPDGATRWSDVRDEWPDEPFDLYGPASTSGTFDWFTENVIGEAGSHRDDYEATEEDNIIIQGIEGSAHAMGYFGYAYYVENDDRVKAIEIKRDESGTCTEPSLENAKSGDYPLARPLFIYPRKESLEDRTFREFVRFYLEQAETDLVAEIGYVPTSTELRDENLDRLDAAIEEVTG